MALSAQHALAPGGSYDPTIPTPASVLAYELGDGFTPHHLVIPTSRVALIGGPGISA